MHSDTPISASFHLLPNTHLLHLLPLSWCSRSKRWRLRQWPSLVLSANQMRQQQQRPKLRQALQPLPCSPRQWPPHVSATQCVALTQNSILQHVLQAIAAPDL